MPKKPPQSETRNLLLDAAIVRLFDQTGDADYVALQCEVTPAYVLAAVVADTRRKLSPRDPGKAALFVVAKREAA